MPRDLKALIAKMTVEEKAGLCSGADWWHTKGVERLGIPPLMMSDGPHGLRKQDDMANHPDTSIPAVCFPAACAAASSFDRDLMRATGETLGDECRAENLGILLGPAVNIKRSPLCGRNFEYMSEDPYLTGELAAAYIEGVQSRDVGVSLKHYAANNQEYRRLTVDARIDERALREIYLTGFETAVKRSRPWTLMCSYNKVNGVQVSENKALLTDILRDEWGFDGFVMSDWGAVADRVKGLEAGLELEMPHVGDATDKQIAAAVQNGTLAEAVLDRAVERILEKVFAYHDKNVSAVFDKERHHEMAAAAARESAVLLKNDGGVLPLSKTQDVVFIGEFAARPRFQGGGSSHVNAFKITSALDAVPGVRYVKGFPFDSDAGDDAEIKKAVEAAQKADAVVVFAGLPDAYESEGYDRTHMRLPDCQNRLIEAVCAVQPRTAVVLHNGSPVEMPWAGNVPAILEMYLGGQAVGRAAADILFGDANPCGKLAESFPFKLADNPSHLNFPGDGKTVEYDEGVFVGYRYYDAKEMDVLFPFGHGLSYTTFAYSGLRIAADGGTVTVSVDVTNTGAVPGKEIVQLYVGDRTGAAVRPPKELKGFVKLELAPGQTKTASFTLGKRAFAWYHAGIKDWYHAPGEYEILVAASSRDVRLRGTATLAASGEIPFRVDMNTVTEDVLNHPRLRDTLLRFRASLRAAPNQRERDEQSLEVINQEMGNRWEMESPLRILRNFHMVSQEELDKLIDELNRLLL